MQVKLIQALAVRLGQRACERALDFCNKRRTIEAHTRVYRNIAHT